MTEPTIEQMAEERDQEREANYRHWCYGHGLDPLDVESMRAHQEWEEQ